MKKIILLALLALILFSCSKNTHSIKGTLSTDRNGKTIYLKEAKRRSLDAPIDSAIIRNNTFNIGKNNLKGIYSLELEDMEPILVILEGDLVEINMDIADITNSSFGNSEINETFKAYNKGIKDLELEKGALGDEYNRALENGADLLLDELESKVKENTSKLESTLRNFINDNPSSIITAYIVYNSKAFFNEKELDEIYNKFEPDLRISLYAQNIKETLDGLKRTEVGKPFIDLKMKSPEGNEISISDYVGKGKYVLVKFWASWCPSCRMDNPHAVDIYAKYGNNLEIIGVSLDKSEDNWKKAIADDNLTWVHMSDLKYWESAAMAAYAIRSIPFFVLIDNNGKIAARGLTSSELGSKLEELFQ